MKRIIKNLLIMLIMFIGIGNIKALDNKYGIYCTYGDYYFIYSGSSLDDTFNIDTNFNDLGILIEYDRPRKSLNNEEEKEWLISKAILMSDGYLGCPVNPFGAKIGAATDKECGTEGCNTGSIPNKESDSGNKSSGYNTATCGAATTLPAALPIFIRNIITIIKIAVPIILVIMGMLDFSKAVTSNDEKGMKEAQGKFVKRLVAGVAIFLVITIVQFIFRIINTDDTNEMASCIDCFINGDCRFSYDDTSKTPSEEKGCYQCISDSNKKIWSDLAGATGYCQGGAQINYNISESNCKDTSSSQQTPSGPSGDNRGCYQCTSNTNKMIWANLQEATAYCEGGAQINYSIDRSNCTTETTSSNIGCYQCTNDSSKKIWTNLSGATGYCQGGAQINYTITEANCK